MRRQDGQAASRTTVFGRSQLSLRRDLGEERANVASQSGSSQILGCDSAAARLRQGILGIPAIPATIDRPPVTMVFAFRCVL